MPSFGDRLRRAREKKSITLEQIAEGTKIGVRYLRALEEGDYDPLPGGVFDRGYVRAYAQAVGLDPEATVRAYLEERGEGAEEAGREEQTLEALRRAADRHVGGAASTIPWLSLSSTQRNVLIGASSVVLIGLSVWAVIALVGSDGAERDRLPATTGADASTRPLATPDARDPTRQPASTSPTQKASDRDATETGGAERASTAGAAAAPRTRESDSPPAEPDAAKPVEAADNDRATETPRVSTQQETRSETASQPAPDRTGLAVERDTRGDAASQRPPEPTEPSSEPVDARTPPPGASAGEPRAAERDPAPAATEDDAPIRARIVLDRAVTGSVNCDNRRVEVLDGMRPGTVLDLACRRFLLLNAPDGGGIRVGLNGRPPVPLVEDGEPLDRFGIYR